MKFNVNFSVDDSDVVRLEWDVPIDEDGFLHPEDSDFMMVFEREGIDENSLMELKKYMLIMVKAYVEGGFDNEDEEGRYTVDAQNEG